MIFQILIWIYLWNTVCSFAVAITRGFRLQPKFWTDWERVNIFFSLS